MNSQIKSTLTFLLRPKAIIFGIALLNFMLSLMYVRQVESDIQARVKEGIWPYPAHWNPVAVMHEPSLLLVASISLLIGRWWGYLLAILASGLVIYTLGYSSWTAVSNAHGVPMFSWQALEKLWYVIYEPRPQYLFEVALAAIVFTYAIFLLSRSVYYKYGLLYRTASNNSFNPTPR
jgi:hypothetical protein